MKYLKYTSAALLMSVMASCGSDFLNVDPTQVVTDEQIKDLAKDDPVTALQPSLNGAYYNWDFKLGLAERQGTALDHTDAGFIGIMMLSDVMSNDISFYNPNDSWTFDHILDFYQKEYGRCFQPWNFFYTVIKDVNQIISQIPEDTNAEGKAIKGQALALRGISYAYLAQFYQKTYVGNEDKPGVPLLLSKNEESIQTRASLRQVYTSVEQDLLNAINLLDGWGRKNKAQIDKAVAQGLLSRVYLVMNKWTEAATMAHEARSGYSLMTAEEAGIDGYNSIKNKEWMWGADITAVTTKKFASFSSWMCTTDGGYGGTNKQYRLIDANLYSQFGKNDKRKSLYLAPDVKDDPNGRPGYANDKFKKVDGWLADYGYMRVSEMYLTEAEALARGGKEAQAATVMKEFMANRDADWNQTTISADEVYTQRRLELWGEGFGYFDCRRLKQGMVRDYTGTNETQSMWVNIPAESPQWTYQISLKEIQNNEYLTEDDQNEVE